MRSVLLRWRVCYVKDHWRADVVTGVITSFDEGRGDGWLSADDGGKYYFHCLAIVDGSRSIAAGARASGFRVVGHLGRDEVIEVRTF